MATVAGLFEVTKEPYLRGRIGQVQRFAQKLQEAGIPLLLPPGGHAVYLEMNGFFTGCDRKPDDFASVGFTLELIKAFGVRAAEAGPFGWEWDKKSPEEQKKIPNLVRFAVPRHVLSEDHINYAVASIKSLHDRRHTIPNVVITRGKEMRLRHFSSGLKPVPVSTKILGSYTNEASRQLTHLSNALDQEDEKRVQLISAFKLAAGRWGEEPIPQTLNPSAWLSNVSNDNAFFEYSVAIDQTSGEAELRFLIEAQPEINSISKAQKSALDLNKNIADKYRSRISLKRWNSIRELFMPSRPQGMFAAWYSYASAKQGPEWKIYLNTYAAGPQNAISITRQAFERLGLKASWDLVQEILSKNESVVYFSLDLSSDTDHARVKVYVSHPGTSASEIAQKHVQICPNADSYKIQQFCSYMAGGPLGPYHAKSLLSCFAFTSEKPTEPEGTIHFPVIAYAKDDAEIQERVERYMAALSVSPLFKERYRKTISAVQRRPLAANVGLHAWVSLKQGANGKRSNTFYLSPELFSAVKFGQ